MATYRKERNLIKIRLDNSTGEYTLDITTGVFYGIKGSPIKTCPRRSEIAGLFPRYRNEDGTNLGFVIRLMLDDSTQTANYARYTEAMQSADKVDALGMPLLRLDLEAYNYLGQNMKALSAWRKDNEDTAFRYLNFRMWCDFENVKKKIGGVADLLTPEMHYEINRRYPEVTTEELSLCAYYLGRNKLWDYHNGDIRRLVQYLEECKLMDKAPQKVNNFMREWCETHAEFELRKREFDCKRMAMNYAKHAKAWEFEHGDYTIVVPTSADDIITEGRDMHHCVGSYVNQVLENQTYIVFVRNKNRPDKCYITCQVYTDGRIGQYFLAYDRYISEQADRDFYEAYARHLKSVWNEQ